MIYYVRQFAFTTTTHQQKEVTKNRHINAYVIISISSLMNNITKLLMLFGLFKSQFIALQTQIFQVFLYPQSQIHMYSETCKRTITHKSVFCYYLAWIFPTYFMLLGIVCNCKKVQTQKFLITASKTQFVNLKKVYCMLELSKST